ncbi:M48 family metallopeptidase [Candidatus Methylacidithermus pantelleriae]|uniref:Putative Peptidase M48 n=1 Tax=Candidatus Methylacidithermus pantelleriae TaxID=2744239 RepID=A0A8J2BP00_9BACT|nr:M48 family metallopeptidase [Candidatus Methylacidithermus pantelleriae]CAF0700157.1 putative Peptidase M48 [Candidatus Methylacidithermus pantelleriae]
MNAWIVLLCLAVSIRLGLESGLASRQFDWLRKAQTGEPQNQEQKTIQKRSLMYCQDRLRLGLARRFYGALLFMGWTFGKGLASLHGLFLSLPLTQTLRGSLFLLVFGLAQGILYLPWSIYETFGLEARYGFNRTSPILFAVDRWKETSLFVFLGFPFFFGLLWLLESSQLGWLWVWAMYCGFSFFLRWAYPVWLAPLFHRFRPLEADWSSRMQRLLGEHGLAPCTLWVMDASRRSGHSNAYFAGVGQHRRVVLYDTLLEQLSLEEAEAVLLHEIGHYKLRHERFLTVLEVGITFLCAVSLPWFYRQKGLFAALGFACPSYEALLALVALVGPTVAFPLQPFLTRILRRLEAQADAFVVRLGKGKELASALQKIYGENAVFCPTEPMYAAFYSTHPPPESRLRQLAHEGAQPLSGKPLDAPFDFSSFRFLVAQDSLG